MGLKLNIGCGGKKLRGYTNLDFSADVNPDIVWDLEKGPLPFQDNIFSKIVAEHVLEHISNFVSLMHELWRICENGAVIKIKTPFYSSWGQFNDPTHVRFFSPFTFNYFRGSGYSHQVGVKEKLFNVKKVKLNFGIGTAKKLNWIVNPLVNFNHKFYCRFFAWIFPVSEIEYELVVLKQI